MRRWPRRLGVIADRAIRRSGRLRNPMSRTTCSPGRTKSAHATTRNRRRAHNNPAIPEGHARSTPQPCNSKNTGPLPLAGRLATACSILIALTPLLCVRVLRSPPASERPANHVSMSCSVTHGSRTGAGSHTIAHPPPLHFIISSRQSPISRSSHGTFSG